MHQWSPDSWQKYTYLQAAPYANRKKLNQVVDQLSLLPPLVTSGEIKQLKSEIARAGRGEAFILQGGDCAESFDECRSEIISNKLKIMLQMGFILLHGLAKPIIRIGRIAGQYAKPRSSDFETINGITLPSYRGDIINSQEFTKVAREPDPNRLLQAYSYSAMTLNFIRALLDGGFADLHHPERWDLRVVAHSLQKEKYWAIVKAIGEDIDFIKSVDNLASNMEFYTSHEALHLHYEQALTRHLHDGHWYNLSTHLPWIGMRTSMQNSAHIELLRGVENPIGIKIGPQTSPKWLAELLAILNPRKEEGRIILYTRLGAKNIDALLPPLIKAVGKTNIPVTWSSDPMHGNTEMTPDGTKTRHFDNILLELQRTLEIHRVMGTHLGGVHFELTGDNVTECIGGARGLDAKDLKKAYHTLVDPRLNYEQSLEMALQLSHEFKKV